MSGRKLLFLDSGSEGLYGLYKVTSRFSPVSFFFIWALTGNKEIIISLRLQYFSIQK